MTVLIATTKEVRINFCSYINGGENFFFLRKIPENLPILG